MNQREFEDLMAMRSGRMVRRQQIPQSADDEDGILDVYVEQGARGQDMADLVFLLGSSTVTMSFLKAQDLDVLAKFLTESAHELRKRCE